MSKRRVVVSGVGCVTPLGLDGASSWKSLLECRSGIKNIEYFDVTRFACKIAGCLPKLDLSQFIDPKNLRRMDKFISYGLIAAEEAISDSGLCDDEPKERIGVIVGSGIGGLGTIERTSIELSQSDRGKVSPFFIPASLINLLSSHIAIKHGFTGINTSITTACAASTHAIGESFRTIERGDVDIIITGGSEAPVNEVGVAGFVSAQALTCKYNDHPQLASRPWDQDRSGFVIGEGAGILVLEEYEHAKSRNAKIYGEIVGYGATCDAYHITAPSGIGGKQAMLKALEDAKISSNKIDYINGHGTSTPKGDLVELLQVQEVFGENISMSSNKSSIGHLLGAAGAVEAIFSLYALRDKVLPPTLNLENPIKETKINLVPLSPQKKNISYIMSNSFGFGGTNATIIIKKI